MSATTPTTHYRKGRKPNDPNRHRVRLHASMLSTPVPTPPISFDMFSHVPASTWGMDGNDNVGDCTCADVDHEVKADQLFVGNAEVVSTAAEVLAAYSAITGYNPADPNTDQGAEMQAVRDYWLKTGFTLGGKAHKILLFAELDTRDEPLVKWALQHLGAIGLGINFPDSAMDQFNAGQPWDVVKGAPAPTEGHAIALLGWDASVYYVLTWGRVQKMTPAFFEKYVEEAWTVLSPDYVPTTGNAAAAAYALGQEFALITGKPNPVPAPNDPPQPSTAPVHVTLTADQFAAVEKWANSPHVFRLSSAAAKAIKAGTVTYG